VIYAGLEKDSKKIANRQKDLRTASRRTKEKEAGLFPTSQETVANTWREREKFSNEAIFRQPEDSAGEDRGKKRVDIEKGEERGYRTGHGGASARTGVERRDADAGAGQGSKIPTGESSAADQASKGRPTPLKEKERATRAVKGGSSTQRQVRPCEGVRTQREQRIAGGERQCVVQNAGPSERGGEEGPLAGR